jgi:hypothetical protein
MQNRSVAENESRNHPVTRTGYLQVVPEGMFRSTMFV